MDESNKKEEIKVEDRRHFDKEGNLIQSSEAEVAKERSDQEGANDDIREKKERSSRDKLEKIDFITLLSSFVHTALVHLGDLEDPLKHTVSENLEAARQTIDTLEILHEKTKGNLDPREHQFLESALFDLRMRYMQKTKLIQW